MSTSENSSACLQAVLIENDEVSITDLSAIVTSNGQRGDNLIKDYDKVVTLGLSCIAPSFYSTKLAVQALILLDDLHLHCCSILQACLQHCTSASWWHTLHYVIAVC